MDGSNTELFVYKFVDVAEHRSCTGKIFCLGGYSLLRISVRSIADAPDELLDERQVVVRNTSYRYAYYAMGYLLLGLLLLMFFGPQLQMFQSKGNDGSFLMIAALFAYSSMPSMVIAWRERDI